MIQIRDVPEDVNSILKAHAARKAMSARRRLATEERIDPRRAEQLMNALELLPAKRYEHTPLLGRIWELRLNFTSYEAAYISLPEATGAVLYTCDRKLAKGHRAKVRLFNKG